MRNLGPVFLIVLMLATNSFAAPAVVQSSVIPEPGLLALLGGGLVGLATLIRRHLSDWFLLAESPLGILYIFFMFAPPNGWRRFFKQALGDETSLKLRAEWYSA